MMVSDSVLSSSGVDMTATRELAEERTNHRCHVDARAVGAHGVGLKRSSACLNPQKPTGPYRALLKQHRAVRYSTHTSAAFGRTGPLPVCAFPVTVKFCTRRSRLPSSSPTSDVPVWICPGIAA